MKTNLLSLLSIAGMLFFAACASDEPTNKSTNPQEPDNKGLTAFVVEDDSPKSRTTAEYDGSGINFYWTEGDRLWVNNTTLIQDKKNTIGEDLVNHPTKPTAVKRAATAKFYFEGNYTASSYPVRYTGKGNTVGDKVTIKAQQNQNIPNDASHIGESGDCGTAIATKSGGRYNFALDHKASYLTFIPYNLQGGIIGAHISQIKVTADKAIGGEFDFNDTGIDINSRPATTTDNQSITLTLNGTGLSTGFPIPGGAANASENAAVMVLAPGTYSTFTIEYTLHDNITGKGGFITKTYNNLTLHAGRNKRVVTDLNIQDIKLSSYYLWDAINPYWYSKTLPEQIINDVDYSSYGVPTASDGTNRWFNTAYYGFNVAINASHSCIIAPNANEMGYYVEYGAPHWDNNTLWSFRGHLYKGGLWFKKQAVIYNDLKNAGYTQLTSQNDMKNKFYSSPSDAIGIDFRSNHTNIGQKHASNTPLNTTTDYFFLPLSGLFVSGKLVGCGERGDYWVANGMWYSGDHGALYIYFFSGIIRYTSTVTRNAARIVRSFE